MVCPAPLPTDKKRSHDTTRLSVTKRSKSLIIFIPRNFFQPFGDAFLCGELFVSCKDCIGSLPSMSSSANRQVSSGVQ